MARGPRQTGQEAREAIKRTIARDRFASGLNGRVQKILQELEREIVAKLATFDPQNPSRRADRLRQLKVEVAEEIARRYDLARREAAGELKELAIDEARWKESSLKRSWNASGANIDVALAPTPILEALVSKPVVLGAPADDYWAQTARGLAEAFVREMQLGVAGGESIGDLITRVRGSKTQGVPGIMSVSRRDAESLVRTSVNSIANEAHMTVYAQNADVIEALQHSSILDSRTTTICFGRNALMWKADTLEPIGHSIPFQRPPLHWRCRSIITTVLNVEEPPPIPDFKTYFDSLSTKEQHEIFGVGRSQLFREGRISQKDLLSSSGRPLTLKELVADHGAPAVKVESRNQLKDMLENNWTSVSMEDVLQNVDFVKAEREALSIPATIADEDNIPSGFFKGRKYSKVGSNFKPTGDDIEASLSETLSNIRKRGEYFAGDEGPLYEKRATIVLGPPAAGKSTLAEKIAKDSRSAIVDVDEAKGFIPGFKNGLGASAVHNESAVLTEKAFQNVYNEGLNVVLPKVGGTVKSIEKTIAKLKAAGYDVDVVNLLVDQDEAARRMGMRFIKTGRLIPSDFYRSIGGRPRITYNEVKRSAGVRSYAEVNANGKEGEEFITDGAGSIFDYLRKKFGRS